MKKQAFCMAIVATLFAGPVSAYDVTANAGAVSEYVFRGLPQTDGNAAAQGGLDISKDLFDYSISYINSDSKLADDSYLLFGIVKNFDLFSK